MKNKIMRLTDNLYIDNKDAALLAEANLTIGKDEDGESVFVCYTDELSEDGKNYVDVTTFKQVHSNQYGTTFISDKIIGNDFEMVSEILNVESADKLENDMMKIINIHDEIITMAYTLQETYNNIAYLVDKSSPLIAQETVQHLHHYVVLVKDALDEVKTAENEDKLAVGLYKIYFTNTEATKMLKSVENEMRDFYRTKQPKNYGKYHK